MMQIQWVSSVYGLLMLMCATMTSGHSSPTLVITTNTNRMLTAQEENDSHDIVKENRNENESDSDSSDGSDQDDLLIQHYHLFHPSEIRRTMLQWNKHYSTFITVTTAQDSYGFPAAGTTDDCKFDHTDADGEEFQAPNNEGCLNFIGIVQDYEAHPVGSTSAAWLPTVLWSGEVHGDERVGPTAVLEATQLLLDAAQCEAKPRMSLFTSEVEAEHTSDPVNSVWAQELRHARACREQLYQRGISDVQRQWLSRLVATRRIIVVPTANALGYERNIREENNVDPNRDFPFDVTNPTQCMQTIAARTLNELYRNYIVQLALTFHGGMEIVAYEWGAPSYDKFDSPDDVAQSQIAAAYSRYAGGFKGTVPYQTGAMNLLVYAVQGGMEDWAYAASWDPDHVVQCQPLTFGGYAVEKTTYSNSTHRVFNMLIETSNAKTPLTTDLGTSLNLLDNYLFDDYKTKAGSERTQDSESNQIRAGSGHVSRNIRLSLLSAELVEPYTQILSINGMRLADDMVPTVSRQETDDNANRRSLCSDAPRVRVRKRQDADSSSYQFNVTWVVGGAISVDETMILYGRWSEVPVGVMSCGKQINMADLVSISYQANPLGAKSGQTQFASVSDSQSAMPPSDYGMFSAFVDLGSLELNDLESSDQPPEEIFVVALARVDHAWTSQPSLEKVAPPDTLSQAHMVNVRNKAAWRFENNGFLVQGREYWFGKPLTLVIGGVLESDADTQENMVELTNRFRLEVSEPSEVHADTGSSASPEQNEMTFEDVGTIPAATSNAENVRNDSRHPFTILLMLIIIGGFLYGMYRFHLLREELRRARRERLREFIEDETAPSPGLAHKKRSKAPKKGGHEKQRNDEGHSTSQNGYQNDHNGSIELSSRYTDQVV
jgi:hypothetical protein